MTHLVSICFASHLFREREKNNTAFRSYQAFSVIFGIFVSMRTFKLFQCSQYLPVWCPCPYYLPACSNCIIIIIYLCAVSVSGSHVYLLKRSRVGRAYPP